MTNRRQFLGGVCAGLGVAALPQVARATVPCQFKVLEIFIYGAMSHLDTFWVEQGATSPWRLEPDMGAIDPAVDGETSIPFLSSGQYGLPYALAVGAGFAPFVGTPLFERMRLLSMYTDLGVHPVAAAIQLTGAAIGRPGSASNGAYIQGQFESGGPPVAYVIDANKDAQVTRFATTTSQIATGRPFVVPMGSDGFVDRLDRSGVVTDGLVDMYRARYDQMLHHDNGRVRAPAFDTYSDSLDRSIAWEEVRDLLVGFGTLTSPANFDTSNPANPIPNYLANPMTRAIALAGYLLEHGARHVTVLGGGSNAHPTTDTHDLYPGPDYVAHATRQNGVLYGITKAVRELYDNGQLPLDDVTLKIGSEFGRRADNLNGSEHWVAGYAQALIGGPIETRGVVGNLNFGSDPRGIASDGVHPSEVNAALCIAAGVDPAQFGSPAQTSALTTKVLGIDPTTLSCEPGLGIP